jgi:hypothetical protein
LGLCPETGEGVQDPFVTTETWVVESTPVECARSCETAKRSELAGFAGYGYCSSHSRFFVDRPGLLIIADKGYVSRELDSHLAERGVRLLRPSYRNRAPHPAQHLFKPVRQLIESINQTLKGQLDLELHGGRPLSKLGITRLGALST